MSTFLTKERKIIECFPEARLSYEVEAEGFEPRADRA
jgi:hypothetical protein